MIWRNVASAIFLAVSIHYIPSGIDDVACTRWLANDTVILPYSPSTWAHTLVDMNGNLYPNDEFPEEQKDTCTKSLHSRLRNPDSHRKLQSSDPQSTLSYNYMFRCRSGKVVAWQGNSSSNTYSWYADYWNTKDVLKFMPCRTKHSNPCGCSCVGDDSRRSHIDCAPA